MAWTVAGAKTEILYRLRDSGGKLLADAQLTTLLDNGCKQFAQDTRSLRFRVSYTPVATTGETQIAESAFLAAGQSLVAVESVEWNEATSGTPMWRFLQVGKLRDILEYVQGGIWSSSSEPQAWAVDVESPSSFTASVQYLYLFPSLSAGTYTNRLRITGSRLHTTITTSTTATSPLEFRPDLQEGPILWCEWKGLQRDGRDPQAAERAQFEYQRLVAYAKTSKRMTDDMPSSTRPFWRSVTAGMWGSMRGWGSW